MVLEKFNELYALAEEVPFIINIMLEDNFKLFLRQTGELPKLHERELESINQYLLNRYSFRLQVLKVDFIEELQLSNVCTSNDNQLKEYCKLLLKKLDPISYGLFEGSFVREIKENNLYPIPLELLNLNGSNDTTKDVLKLNETPLQRMGLYTYEERKIFKLLTDVFHENYFSYKVISAVEQEIKTVMVDRGFASEEELFDLDFVNLKDKHQTNSIKTIAHLFKSANTYDKLINFMCNEQLLSKGTGSLNWYGYKSNAKYEIASFHEALFLEGLLFRKAANDTELASLASNTFHKFEVNERTMRNKAYSNKIKDYRDMLICFKQI